MAKLRIGGKAKIKQEAWVRFCKEHNKDPDQPNPGEKEIPSISSPETESCRNTLPVSDIW